MRVRKRYAAMLAIAALIVGVVVFQAVTAKPPEPYVELVGVMPTPPVMRFDCRGDQDWVIYTNGQGDITEQATGDPCGSRGWDASGDRVAQPNRP